MNDVKSKIKPVLVVCFALMSLLYQTTALATIKMSIEKIINTGDKKTIVFKLTDAKSKKAIQLDDLALVHTQKIHLLIIDDSLSDYSHIHPVAGNEPGVYLFSWYPTKIKANYRIWADLVPVSTNHQQYVRADLYKAKTYLTKIIPKEELVAVVDGYQFKLAFDEAKLQQGKGTMGKIEVSDALGNPVHDLEPLMGAYAHIVGFGEDFKSIVHIHPMGAEPKKDSDRGGPELSFHLEPAKAGTIKLFAQVKIKGKEYFAPFSLVVK